MPGTAPEHPSVLQALGERAGELLAAAIMRWLETGETVNGSVIAIGPAATVANISVTIEGMDVPLLGTARAQ